MSINKLRNLAVYCYRYVQSRPSDRAESGFCLFYIQFWSVPGDTRNRMNNTFRRKEKTKIKIINTGAERWRGCAEEFWQNFATAAQNYESKKFVETWLLYAL